MHWDTAHKPTAPRNGTSGGGGYIRGVFFIATVEMTEEENASSPESRYVTHAVQRSQELSL